MKSQPVKQPRHKNVEVSADYKVLNEVIVSEVTYTITWSVSVTEGVVLEVGDNETTVNVDEMLSADLDYVLTATIADPDGNTIEVGFNRKVLALQEEVWAAIESAPVEGVAYKLHAYQSSKEQDCYFNGKMSGYYFATSEDISEAVDVFVEYVAGSTTEFYPYFMSGDAKQYMGMRVSSDGGHNNIVYDANPVSVFVWNAEIGTMTTTIVDKDGATTEFYFGNYSTHVTISGSAMSHVNGADTNLAFLKTPINRSEVSDASKVADEYNKLKLDSLNYIGNATIANLPALGEAYPDVAITWEVAGDCASYNNGTVTLTVGDVKASATLTATLTLGDEVLTKEFVVNVIPNTEAAIVEAAYALPSGQAFANNVTLTGVVTSIDTAFDSEFQNITVTMNVLGKAIKCYRLAGNGADELAKGYSITVSGIIKNFNGTIEFDAGCYLEAFVYGEPPAEEVVAGQATITFDDVSKRTEFDTEHQVWEQNGIKITNNKAGSSTNVGNYSNPARFYKNSDLIIEYSAAFTKIVFDCSGFDAKYMNGIKDSIADGSTVTVDGSIITVELASATTSWTMSMTSAQGRANSITVYTA